MNADTCQQMMLHERAIKHGLVTMDLYTLGVQQKTSFSVCRAVNLNSITVVYLKLPFQPFFRAETPLDTAPACNAAGCAYLLMEVGAWLTRLEVR
jgi:hypothetical protein